MKNLFEGKTILVVDDEEYNWFLFKESLDDLHLEVLWAGVAQKAIDKIASGRRIDLVLMDIKLPIKDGYQATAEIKKINPSIPVIAQTAYSSPEEIFRCIKAGCDDYISKPIDFTELRIKMEKIFRKTGQA